MAARLGRDVSKADSDCGRQFWADARVLVTGARGFVGRHLVRHLGLHGASVTRLVRLAPGTGAELQTTTPMISSVVGASATDLPALAELIKNRKISTVFHLAAVNVNRGAGVSPYTLFETNIRGTYTLLEACRAAASMPRVVVLSSREAEHCFDLRRVGSLHPYAASKASAELIAGSFADTFGLKVVALRMGNIYGGGDLNWNRLIPSTIRAFLRGQRAVINDSLYAQRDYIHVDDVVGACLAAATHADGLQLPDRLIRISTGLLTSTTEIVQKLASATGRPDLALATLGEVAPKPLISRPMVLNQAQPTGWQSTVSLEHGLSKTVAWYRRYLSRYEVH